MNQLRRLLNNKTSLTNEEKDMIVQTFDDIYELEKQITLLVQDKIKLKEDYKHLMKIVVDLGTQLKKSN
jgi:hypothetical protein